MFDTSILDAGLALATLLALAGGLLSFLSPCVLPVVPPYLAYISGISMTEMTGPTDACRRVILPAIFFVLGLSTIFLLLGFAATLTVTPVAAVLAYTDPTTGTYQLKKNAALSTATHLVLELVGPATTGCGVSATFSADTTKVTWVNVSGADPANTFVANGTASLFSFVLNKGLGANMLGKASFTATYGR